MRRLACLALLACASLSHAADDRKGRELGLNMVAGVPELAGLQLTYGTGKFVFGAGFGTAPLQSVLSARIPLSPVPLDLATSDVYNIYPRGDYGLTGFTLFTRYFPGVTGFFLSLGYTSWTFRGDVIGDLKNETLGTTSPGAITGSLRYPQPIVNLGLGYQVLTAGGFYFDIGLGVGYLMQRSYDLNFGGTSEGVVPVVAGAEESFENAKDDIRRQVENGVQQFRDSVKIIPTIFIGAGWAFDLG